MIGAEKGKVLFTIYRIYNKVSDIFNLLKHTYCSPVTYNVGMTHTALFIISAEIRTAESQSHLRILL